MANSNSHTICGQHLDRIEGEIQSMRIDSKCTNLIRTLTKLEDQINTGILNNIENNPRREGKEHMKEIMLRSSKVVSSLENPTQKEVVAPTIEPKIETIKDSIVVKILFPSRLEEKQKQDED
ncbi:acidic leucine-rich nuclear phosphoprotein 32 family member B-like [Gossypium australe]|uniref:Acidic leucine-rich nuclear phosphoprotein 32 family member B-like n=1 Tax=Gossypium australe TaxID=47621 RepID=A0A5B6WFY0_9ROSI|nr:acidic leucine-rich nuclear phosphoprotein 32 family member B-like [Gossypium australe]